MRGQAGFFDVDERLKELWAKGDGWERLNAVVDFELFRADLERAVPRSDRSKGGRPPFDHVLQTRDDRLAPRQTLLGHDHARCLQLPMRKIALSHFRKRGRRHSPPFIRVTLNPMLYLVMGRGTSTGCEQLIPMPQ